MENSFFIEPEPVKLEITITSRGTKFVYDR